MIKLVKYYLRAVLLLLLVCSFGVHVQAEETEEEVDYTCGASAVWSYDKASKTLTVSGSGQVVSNSWWQSFKVKKLVVEEGITILASYCFNGMQFTQVKLPESLTEIGRGAFSYANRLQEIKIPSSVTVIGDSAFSGCRLLTEVRVPDTVEILGTYCFGQCDNLQSVELPKRMKDIGEGMFDCCGSLKEVIWPSRLETIGKSAFAYCQSLEKLSLPKGLKRIDEKAFYRSGLVHVMVPESVKKLDRAVFSHCDNLRTAEIKTGIKKLPDELFKGCKMLRKVSFSDETKKVGEYAFAGCEELKKVNFRGKLEAIQYKAFARTGFKSIRLEGSLRNVDYRAFQQCVRLKEVYVGKEIKKLYRNTFSGCSALKRYTVSEENMHYSSMDGSLLNKSGKTLIACPSGRKGTYLVPETVKTISNSAFVSCTGIKAYRLTSPGGKYTVQKGILYCDNGTSLFACPSGKKGKIVIPSAVTCIKRNAFQNSGAKKVILPKALKQMEYCAFRNCRNLKSITIPGSLKKIDNAVFWSCRQLKSVTVNMGTKKIARNAFFDCRELQKVKLPATVEKIHSTAFANVNYRVVFYCTRASYAMDFVHRKRFSYRLI